MYQLCIQYCVLRYEVSEELVDAMIKEHFLVYQPLPPVINTSDGFHLSVPSPHNSLLVFFTIDMKDSFCQTPCILAHHSAFCVRVILLSFRCG